MGSIGSMSKPENGFLAAAIQFPAPVVNLRADIDKPLQRMAEFDVHRFGKSCRL